MLATGASRVFLGLGTELGLLWNGLRKVSPPEVGVVFTGGESRKIASKLTWVWSPGRV